MSAGTKTLSNALTVKSSWTYQKAFDNQTPKDQTTLQYSNTFATGTADGQNDILFCDRRSVGAGTANDDLDLAGILADIFGDTLTFVEVVTIIIKNRSTTSGDKLQIGGAGAVNNAFGAPFNGNQDSQLTCGPNHPVVLGDGVGGLAVTAGSEDVLRISYDGVSGSIEYDIVVTGRSA